MIMRRIFKEIVSKNYVSNQVLNYKYNRGSFVISKKYFCVSHILNARPQQENENKHAYSIMENRGYVLKLDNLSAESKLTKDMFETTINEDWSRKSPRDIFNMFPKFSMYCSENNLCISNNIFDKFIDALTDNMKFASDEELVTVFNALHTMPPTESVRSRNFIEVWAALDDECLNRYKEWSFDVMLQYVSRFYMLGITRLSDYCVKCIRKLTSKASQLTPEQIVKTYFFIGLLRKSPLEMHNLELYVLEYFSEFSVDELAVISMGLFKTKTPIRNMELVYKIIDKIIENSKHLQDISLVALLKIIRYSMKIPDNGSIYELLDKLQKELPRLNVMANVHMALLGTATLTLHEQCLNSIAKNIINSIEKARIKDLERIILTFGTFNFKPNTQECFFERVIEELRKPERQNEIDKYGRSLACSLSFLGLVELYPEDLIAKVLQKDFLQQTYGKYCLNYGREILSLNNIAEINNLDPSIPRLKKSEAVLLAKKYTDYMPTEEYVKQYNNTERFCLDVMKVLKNNRGGSEYVTGDHILTHHQRGDIILCNDKDGQPVPVKETFDNKKFGLIRTLPDTDNTWIALVVAGRNVIIKKSNQPTGQFYTKLRELRKLGYKSSLVIWSVYSELKTNEEKLSYLNDVIKNALENKS